MGNKNKPRIMTEDIELIEKIAKHGFVDMDYIYLFAYPDRKKRTVQERINQLVRHGFLIMKKTFIPQDSTASHKEGYKIITLGKQGIYLVESTGVDVLDNIRSIQNASPYRMYHQVQVATVCDVLKKRFDDGGSKWYVETILNEKEAYQEEALNQPDAILIFKQKDLEKSPAILVFLEMERSYTKKDALERKMNAYGYAIDRKLYPSTLRLQVYDQRVLFVSKTQNQKNTLIKKIIGLKEQENFHLLIAGYDDVTFQPLESIYYYPKDQNTYKLLGKLP